MHCMQDGWEDSLLGFMSSGGFKPKNKVPLVTQETCIIWGRNDGILNGEEFANKVKFYTCVYHIIFMLTCTTILCFFNSLWKHYQMEKTN